ncbi:type II toxin-antitoxin system VapC family toxin [soil metagenome]
MASLVVVDSDLLIDFLRGRGPGADLTRTLLREARLRLTAVTAFELRLGADFLARRAEILRLFRSRTLGLDVNSALLAGQAFTALRRQGVEIGMADCLQAGICLRHGLALATRNRRHFTRIDRLRLIDVDE